MNTNKNKRPNAETRAFTKKKNDIMSRAKDLKKRMQEHALKKKFNEQLRKSDPGAASAKAKFNFLKKQGKTPEQIKEMMTAEQRKAFVRSVDAASEFSRKLVK
tara:strand:- start:527 stop:835 length:309 start_codon:yes stop_codon:yes gene_type:complete